VHKSRVQFFAGVVYFLRRRTAGQEKKKQKKFHEKLIIIYTSAPSFNLTERRIQVYHEISFVSSFPVQLYGDGGNRLRRQKTEHGTCALRRQNLEVLFVPLFLVQRNLPQMHEF
jgi:hypothetical protein